MLTNQRRRHSRWRMCFMLLAFIGVIRHGEPAPADASESPSSSSTSVSRRKPQQNIGSLNDFTWQAWLLVDTQTGAQTGTDSATLLRRITPKSVFIAPDVLPACADGYRPDKLNRCVKSVNIDENAHFSFLLQRLNAMYATQDRDRVETKNQSSQQQKQSTGPLQLNIPLVLNSKSQSTKAELADTVSANDSIITPMPRDNKRTTKPQETVLAIYKMKNNTASGNEQGNAFFGGNSSADGIDKTDEKPDASVVPVAEIVEEANDTNFSEIVDYKIPIDLKTLVNTSSVKRLNVSDVGKEDIPTIENSTGVTPRLVLVLSPTKLPTHMETDDPPLVQNDTAADNVIAQVSNTTATHNNTSAKEIVTAGASDSYEFPTSAWQWSPEIPSLGKESGTNRNNETHTVEAEPGSEIPAKLNESREMDFAYDENEEEDEYSYNTDVPDEESAEAEGEEILKHGESTSLPVPTQLHIVQLHHNQPQQPQQRQNQTVDQVLIRFNDTTRADKDEAGSNVSSEVSIDGDLILETTLLDMNTEKLRVITTTSSPDTIRQVAVKSDNHDSKDSTFDEGHSSAPEVVFSPQDTHGTMSTSLHANGRKRAKNYTRTETRAENKNDRNEDVLEAAPSSSESFLYDLPEEDPITEIHIIIDKEPLNVKKKSASTMLDDHSTDDLALRSSVPASSFKQHTSVNLGPTEDYVKFPDYVRRSESYVRFPSSEANSIHSHQNYKQHHSHYPADDVSYSSTSTKSSVPVRQKPVYHLTVPTRNRKLDRSQQADYMPTTQKQRQKPTLLHFWDRMPLVRDSAVYPVDQFPTVETIDVQEQPPHDPPPQRSSSRRARFYTSQRTHVDKALTRKRRRTSTRG